MRREGALFVLVLTILVTTAAFADDRWNTVEDFMTVDGRTRVIAHRGFSSQAPENTLAAVKSAIEVGADMVEIDVTMTSDGHVICIHDETLNRTTNGRGPATALTLAEIQRLDAGSWFSSEFAGEPVPTLAEVLDLVDGRILLNIEIKSEAVPLGVVDAVVKGIRSHNAIHRVVVSSFAPEALRRMKIADPEIVTVSLFNTNIHREMDPLEILQEVGSRGLNMSARLVNPEIIDRCHRHGYPVGVYTVNRKRGMRRVIRMGADSIFTDHPDRLLEVQQHTVRLDVEPDTRCRFDVLDATNQIDTYTRCPVTVATDL